MNTLFISLVTAVADQTPQPADVKAGWTAFAVFLLLFVAVALLGWSLSRQLKKAERNKEAGILPSAKDRKRHDAPQA